MKKVTGILCVIPFVLLICGTPAFCQQAAQQPQYRQEAAPVSVHQISPHVYEVRGGDGANCAFIVGDKNVFVIDAKMTSQSAKKMIAAIRKATNKPISHIILTHSDGDHVNGLSGFSGTPDIIAQFNCAKEIEEANESQEEKISLPNETFDSRMSLYSGKVQIDLLYFGPAHTDGDIVILVPGDKVAIAGDLFFKGRDPLIHMNKNGSSFGLVNVLDRLTELDAQTYLSGHAEPVKKTEIEDLRKRIIETQNKVKALTEEGETLDEVKQALGVSTEQGRWRSLAEVIYLELTGSERK
jgi:cyclase